MSACVSRHGEYFEHEIAPDEYTCQRCFALDEERMRADLDAALAVVERVRVLAAEWAELGQDSIYETSTELAQTLLAAIDGEA